MAIRLMGSLVTCFGVCAWVQGWAGLGPGCYETLAGFDKGGRHLVARIEVSPDDGEVGSAPPPLRRRSGFRSGGVKEARFPPSGRAVI